MEKISLIVIIVAVVMISISIALIIHPASVRDILKSIFEKNWIWPVSIIRLVIGVLLLMAAGSTKFPIMIYTIGTVFIAAAIAVPLMGKSRIEKFALNFLSFPDYILRVLGFFGLLAGIGLALSGMS